MTRFARRLAVVRRAPKPIAAVAALVVAAGIVALPSSGAGGAPPHAARTRNPAAASSGAVLPTMSCADLASHDLTGLRDAPTSITATTPVAATGSTPAYCDVTGYVAPQIQFEVRLPLTTWNGRYYQTGCGGFCGVVPISSCGQALDRNFAVGAENTGHVGTDGLWAYHNRPAEIDWGYRSPHVVSIAAKALIKVFYGKSPAYSYFQGCSTGGRQALSEAQRFPHDFDGIIAGDPANRQNYLAPIAQGWVEPVNRDRRGNLILPKDKLPLLHDAVLSKCDALDGREDGVLDNPSRCTFDPGSLRCRRGEERSGCLTSAQVRVVRDFYSGPRNSHGRILMRGLPLGSELGWGIYDIGTDTSLSGAGNFATQVLRYLAFRRDPGPSYQISDFSLDHDIRKLHYMARIYNADNPDLRRFRAGGGRLILYHGFADPLISPYSTINYYRAAARLGRGLARTQRWVRLFMLPGFITAQEGRAPTRSTGWTISPTGWNADRHPHRRGHQGRLDDPAGPAPVPGASVELSPRRVRRARIAR